MRKASSTTRYEQKPAAFVTKTTVCCRCQKPGHMQKECKVHSETNNREPERRFNGFHRGYRGNSQMRGSFRGRNSRGQRGGNSHQSHRQTYQNQRNYTNMGESGNSQEDGVCFLTDQVRLSSEAYASDINEDKILFYIDSGIPDHLENDKTYFHDYVQLDNSINIAMVKNIDFMKAIGVGNIRVLSQVGKREIECTIKNVFYVPKLRSNLLSVRRLEMSNIKVIFDQGQVCLYNANHLVDLGQRNRLYEI